MKRCAIFAFKPALLALIFTTTAFADDMVVIRTSVHQLAMTSQDSGAAPAGSNP